MNSLGIYVGCSALSSLLEPSKWGLLNALEKVVGWFFLDFLQARSSRLSSCIFSSLFLFLSPLNFWSSSQRVARDKEPWCFFCIEWAELHSFLPEHQSSCVDLSRNRVTMCSETPMPENSSVTPEPTLSSHLQTTPAEVGWCLSGWVLVFHTMVLWGWWLHMQ